MKILHVVAGLPPGGGIAEAVSTLCGYLQRLGHEVVLATVARPGDALSAAAAQAAEAGVRVVRFRASWPHFLYFSWGMALGLGRLARAADAVHVHSLWTFPVWWACRCARRVGKPVVMSPHGCLDPVRLRHAAWKKRLVGWLDRHWLRRAAAIHATCEAERAWVEAFEGSGFKVQGSGLGVAGRRGAGQRIVVVPNGVEVEAFAGTADPAALESRWPVCRGQRVALFLSRIHPLKGLASLVEAWAAVPHEGWRLVIAGGDEKGHEAEVRALAAKRGISDAVIFAGPLYGREKAAVMQAANLFVLPTRSENFGLVVAEALAAGVPVITTKGAPWAELEGERVEGGGLRVEGGGLRVEGGGLRVEGGGLRVEEGERRTSNVECRILNGNGASGVVSGNAGSRDAGVRASGKSVVVDVERSTLNAQRSTPNAERLTLNAEPSTLNPQPSTLNPPPSTLNPPPAPGRCGWWVDIGAEPLAAALREAMGLTDAQRRAMGESGRQLVERKYRWEKVAEAMARVYENLDKQSV